MKNILILLSIVFSAMFALAADVKISDLPLGAGASTGVNDSFPFVQNTGKVTKRLTLYDIANIPSLSEKFAPLVNPAFSGTVTAPIFNGNATTATALAANPTDCAAGAYAVQIDAGGNLTCASVAFSQLTGTISLGQIADLLITDSKLSPIATAGKVLNSATTATDANTPSAIVARDASGNFTAGTITANVTGNASGTAANVTGIVATANGGTGLASTATFPASGTVATIAGTQVLTNKDIDGGTASATNRVTISKNTKANLDALPRKEATLYYGTDTTKAYVDNGSTLIQVGSGSGSGGVNYIVNPGAETDALTWTTFNDTQVQPQGTLGNGTVDETSETFTISGGVQVFREGQAVIYTSSGTAVGGLTSGSTYFIRNPLGAGAISFAVTEGGAVINLTAEGTGDHTFTPLTPYDGSGGTAASTYTRETIGSGWPVLVGTEPTSGSFVFSKSGSANRRGEGFSTDFTIDQSVAGRRITIPFEYRIAVGGSTYVTGDLTWYVLDVTNNVLIGVNGSKLEKSLSPSQPGRISFDSNTTSVSYRLIGFVQNPFATSLAVVFDGYVANSQTNTTGFIPPQIAFSGAFLPVASCLWSRTNAVLGDFAAVAACPGPTVEISNLGTLLSTDTDLPQFTVNDLPANTYRITMQPVVYSSTVVNTAMAISDGTTSCSVGANDGTVGMALTITCIFKYTEKGNRTFKLQARSDSGVFQVAHGVVGKSFRFWAEAYPNSQEVQLSSQVSNRRLIANGYFTNTNIATALTDLQLTKEADTASMVVGNTIVIPESDYYDGTSWYRCQTGSPTGSGSSLYMYIDGVLFKDTSTVNQFTRAPLLPFTGKYLKAGQVITFKSSGDTVCTVPTASTMSYWSITRGSNQGQTIAYDYTAPHVTKLTSGSGTYTVPAGTGYLKIRMVGGGGGGSGSGTLTSGGSGGAGVVTTFGTSLLTANGGAGGVASSVGTAGGAATINSPALGTAISGGGGGGSADVSVAGYYIPGGMGGGSAFGGAGASAGIGAAPAAANSAAANSGSGGGGGAGNSAANMRSGSGGGAGGFIDATIPYPSTTYAYSVGTGGVGGVAGTTGLAGGAGGAGYIEITAHFKNSSESSVPQNIVTTTTASGERIERFHISGASRGTNCVTGPCNIISTSIPGSTATMGSNGITTVTIPVPWSVTPECTCSAIQNGVAYRSCFATGTGLNTFEVSARDGSGTAYAAGEFNVLCMGPK